MRKVQVIILILSLCYLKTVAQIDVPVVSEYDEVLNAKKGYIVSKNNEHKQGYIIVSKEKNNSEYVDFLKFIEAESVRYTKHELKEYGYEGVVYVTMPYKNDVVFMRRMNTKEPFLYYYKSSEQKEFYIQKDNELVLLPTEKNELRGFLSEEMKDCDISIKNSKLAIHNKQRLAFIFERNSECDDSRIPFFNFGVHLGLGISTLSLDPATVFTYFEPNSSTGVISSQVGDVNFNPQSGFAIGFFTDIPLTVKGGKLSFHPEFEIKKNGYSFKKGVNDEFGFDVKYYSTNIFGRYKGLSRKFSTFIDFGFIYSILNTKDSYYLVTTSNTKYDLDPKLENSIFGLGLGAGVSYPFSTRNSLDVSVRYSYLYSQSKRPKVSNLDLVVGIAF